MRLTFNDIPVEVFAFTVASALAELLARSAAAWRAAVIAVQDTISLLMYHKHSGTMNK